MIEKEYYRIDELERRFSLSFSDLRYLVESSKIDLVFYLEQSKFVTYGLSKARKDIGYSTVFYRGLVKVSKLKQHELISKGEINCTRFSLLNREMVSEPDLNYPFESSLPNKFLHNWKPKTLEQITWDTIPAKLFPQEQEHSIRELKGAFNDALSMLSDKEPAKQKPESKFMALLPQKEFYSVGTSLKSSDICVLHSDLVRLNIIPSSEEHIIEKSEPNKPSTPKAMSVFKNDFEELLARILRADAMLPAKIIFRILAEESQLEEDERQYDIKNILLDEVDGVLVWKDNLSRKREKPCSLRTLENKLTEVKVVIREANLSDNSLKASQNHS